MRFYRVSLRGFRNVEEADVGFTDGLNVIYGKNAQGKTNMLEALSYIPACRSFRAARDRDMIKIGCESAEIKADYESKGRNRSAEIGFFQGQKRRLTLDGARCRGTAEFSGSLNCVLFSPDDLYMIKGEPAQRRRFLDAAISQQKPAYLKAISEYGKTLSETSLLIKDWEEQSRSARDSIQSWFFQLAEKGGYISEVRERYVELLNCRIKEFYTDMSGGETVDCSYVTSCGGGSGRERAETIYKKLTENLEKQIAAGTVLYGVQRDDVGFFVDGKELKQFGSQGQQRSAVLSAKLAEGEIIMQTMGEYPVFLFDDVLSELDRDRKNYLLKRLTGKQIMITCCDEREFSDCEGGFIRVENGRFYQ
ncbi:MAG: DNA replication/repair protein RecF [Clostridia bacterium]|nr:DNA replication/repair protein RecF [Clostridia bacterium]